MEWRAGRKKKSIRASKMWFFFIFLSSLIWIFTTLSHTHSTSIPVEIQYVQLADHQVLLDNNPQSKNIFVTSTGFRILGLRMIPLKVDIAARKLEEKEGEFYLTNSFLRPKILSKLTDGVVLNQLLAEQILAPIGVHAQKKIPVKLLNAYELEKGYDWTGPYQFSNDSLVVFGPSSLLDTLQAAYINNLNPNVLRKNISETYEILQLSDVLKWNKQTVEVERELARFTDVSFQIKLQALNVPDSLRLRLVPNEVELRFRAPINHLKSLPISEMILTVDYLKSQHQLSNKLNVEWNNAPDFVAQVKIQPNKISYFFQQ